MSRVLIVSAVLSFSSALAFGGAAASEATQNPSSGWQLPADADQKKNPHQVDDSLLATGRAVFKDKCARCHGMEGKGGNMPGVGVVPPLRDAAWHERTTDKLIASTIAHGKGAMPGFMQELDGKELRGVIAFVRSLKAGAE